MATISITWASYNSTNSRIGAGFQLNGLDTSFEGNRKVNLFLINQSTSASTWVEDLVFQTSEESYSNQIGYSFSSNSYGLPRGVSYKIKLTVQYYNQATNQYEIAQGLEVISNAIDVPPARPDNFTFSPSLIASGQPASNLTATIWYNFCSRINEFRVYKNMPPYGFTQVSSDTTQMTASILAEPYDAISAINGHGVMPSYPVTGNIIYASYFHNLASALNAIQ